MKELNKLDGKEFTKVMEAVKGYSPELYEHVMVYYFSNAGSIEKSWEDDPDEVWDAEGEIGDYCDNDMGLRRVVYSVLETL